MTERKNMEWNLDDSRPIWPQIKEKLMKDIVSGKYPKGGAFPTVRDLAEEAKVNRNTMQRALGELESEGLVITNRTAGRTVTTDDDLLAETRKKLAGSSIKKFMEEMDALGFDTEQTIRLIKENKEK